MPAGLAVRRYAVVFAPLVSALLIVAGFFLDPDIGASGRELAKSYAENPGRIQLSADALHFAFAFLAVPVLGLVVVIRRRGVWLANVAGLAAILGLTTLPGFLLTDFYDVAIYGELGGDAWQTVNDRIEELPGAIVMFVTGFGGFLLAFPLALLAAWRARLLPLWPAVAVAVGEVCAQAVPGGFGLLLWALALAAVTFALRQLEWPLAAPAAEEAAPTPAP